MIHKTFPYQFCDLLVGEIDNNAAEFQNTAPDYCDLSNFVKEDKSQDLNTLPLFPTALVPFGQGEKCTNVSLGRETAPDPRGVRYAVRVSRTLQYIYQRVIRRQFEPFWPNKSKSPNYVLAYVKETLECGHIVEVIPGDGEPLTARRRACHECQGFFGSLDLKKPAGKAKQAQRGRATGKVNWPAVIFATAAMLIIAALLYTHQPQDHILSAPETYIRVLRQFNTYDFQLQEVVHGVPQQPSVWHFCRDFAPQLEAGYTLTQLQWIDSTGCSEIAPRYIHHAYHIERDKGGLPTVPRNCINTSDQPVFCNGEPKF